MPLFSWHLHFQRKRERARTFVCVEREKKTLGNGKCDSSDACALCVQYVSAVDWSCCIHIQQNVILDCAEPWCKVMPMFVQDMCCFEPDWSKRAQTNLFIALLDFVCRQLSLNALNAMHTHTHHSHDPNKSFCSSSRFFLSFSLACAYFVLHIIHEGLFVVLRMCVVCLLCLIFFLLLYYCSFHYDFVSHCSFTM